MQPLVFLIFVVHESQGLVMRQQRCGIKSKLPVRPCRCSMYFPVGKLPLHKHGFYNTRSYLIIHLLRRQTQCTATGIQAVRNKIIRQSFLYIRDVKPGINAIAEWERQSGNEERSDERQKTKCKGKSKYLCTYAGKVENDNGEGA